MKKATFSTLLVLIFLFVSCSSSKNDTDNTVTGPQSNVSTDPAIRNTNIDLVVKPDMFYQNILTEKLSQTHEDITRDMRPLCASCWQSNSFVDVSFSSNIGRMQCVSGAEVVAKPLGTPGIPTFTETCVGKTTLMREFTVDDNGNPGNALAGSVVRFNTAWLGRIVSLSPLSVASYDIRFILRDLTEQRVKIDQKLASNSVKGKLKITVIKGVPIPLALPGWSKDETDDERHAFPIPLITGHTYRIQLTMTLTTITDGLGGAISSFGVPGNKYDLGGFADIGFLEFSKVDLDIGN